jgi:ABC-type branched-subunit amino acid transport system ATPase component/ABC-type branched-subunit amino acid transport system permease subunit
MPPGSSLAAPARRLIAAMGSVPRGWVTCAQAAAIAAFAWVLYVYQPYLSGIVLIYAISVLGLDWIMHRAGQVSLANGPLMAIGAFTTAFISQHAWGVLPVSIIASAVVGGLTGLVIGLPALRVRGLYLVLTTLALQFLVADGLQLYESHTGQVSGYQIPQASLAGISLGYNGSFVAFLAVVLIVAAFFLRGVYRGAPGRAWSATREDEVAASVMGVDVAAAKLVAFVGSSALIAVSGSLLAYYSQQAEISTFTLDFAISFAVMLIVGGAGSVAGILVGATVITLAPVAIQSLFQQVAAGTSVQTWLGTNVYLVSAGLYGLLVLLVLLFLPDGLVPTVLRAASHLLARAAERGGPAPQVARPAAEDRPAATEPAHPRQRGRPLLRVTDLEVQYSSGAKAVAGAAIEVGDGEIVAVLGRNGVGKTSLLRGIAGFFRSEGVSVRGNVALGDTDLSGRSPHQVARQGIVLVPERNKVFPNLTVDEHLKMAASRTGRRRFEDLQDVLRPLSGHRATPAGLLSGGQRQMLAIGMALCAAPRLLMVDEFSLGLAPIATLEIGALLRDVTRKLNLSLLIVEQNTEAALRIADFIYIMDAGSVVASGPSAEFRDTQTLKDVYLGTGEGGRT